MRQVIVGRMAATQNEGAAVEKAALGIVAQIEAHAIGASSIMCVVQAIAAHGDELALVVGGSRRLGIPFHGSRPEDVALAMTHAIDISFQFLIGADGHLFGKLFVVADVGIMVFLTPKRIFSTADKTCQHLALHFFCLRGIALKAVRAANKKRAYDGC